MTLQPDSHLQVGMKAPDFRLPGSPIGDFRLSDELKKGPVIVYFYVSDFGPLCNMVMKRLQENKGSFDELGVQFVGISVDEPRMHGVWKERLKVTLRLLSDENGQVAKEYGVLMEDELYYKMANRAVFLVDEKGVIRYRWVALDPAYEPDYEAVVQAARDLTEGR